MNGSTSAPSVKRRPQAEILRTAVDRVVSALGHLETVTHTVGEPGAHRQLMQAVRNLRATVVKQRNK
ncbi:hypothetical protein EHI47_14465 [Rhizobium leguminosarum]|uniref:Uncharacterized protein n=1 Tax=Rhizobium leguminosarum TaxID=384 RepID=A0A444I0X3_RHILE|nr:hypothetical protein [Rhizobium leguminosarum]RWX30652.1 hypothetical protein EHI47_14465 [Rhizobium leguminosarum]